MKTIKVMLGSAIVFFAAIAAAPVSAGMRHGDGFYGYDMLSRYARPVPPADIPNVGSFKNNIAARRTPPLPRARPGNIATGVARDSAPIAPTQPRAVPPSSPASVAAPRPATPAMVPVAPLE